MIKATIKTLFLIVWIILSIVLLWIIKKTGKKNWLDNFCSFCCAVICTIIGIRIKVEGEVTKGRPLLLVSNHISYLDIFILGWKTPTRFTPKNDIEKWPIISTICRLTNCVFINRSNDKIRESQQKIHNALAAGEVLSLFPEGTTGNGRHTLPFKSSLLSIAEKEINGHKLLIQPAIISYTAIGSLPIDSTQWPTIAWYGDMLLAPHIWQLLKLSKIDATLTLLPPVTISQFANRKQLATYCYNATIRILQRRLHSY